MGRAEIFSTSIPRAIGDEYNSAIPSFGSFTQQERRRGLAMGKSG